MSNDNMSKISLTAVIHDYKQKGKFTNTLMFEDAMDDNIPVNNWFQNILSYL